MRKLFAGPIGLVLAVVGLLFTVSEVTRAAGSAAIVSANDSRIVFDVKVDYALRPSAAVPGTEVIDVADFGTASKPGEPAIPSRSFLVAIPPDGRFSVSYRVLSSEALGLHRLEPVPYPVVKEDENGQPFSTVDYSIDAQTYNGAGTTIGVVAEPEALLRRQRVAPVRVTPVSYDPRTGETTIATVIRVEITLLGTPRGDVPRRPVVETRAWERVYGRALVNPEQGREWRAGSRKATGVTSASMRALTVAAGPLVKLAVHQSGMHRVSAASVVSKGFPAGTATDQLQVFKRYYDENAMTAGITDVHFKVIEDGNGVPDVFDGGDYVVFYGQRLREDALQNDAIEKFAETNIYWLGASGGTQMAQKVVPPGTVSADTTTATFPAVAYAEEDLNFLEETPPNVREFNYYNSPLASNYSAPITIGRVDPASTFVVRVRFMGGDPNRVDRVVKVEIANSIGTATLDDAQVPRKLVVDYASQPFSGNLLAAGLNRLNISPVGRSVLEVVLDYFSIEYRSPFRATGNVLEFNVGGSSGTDDLTVVGLNTKDVMLFDITDPYSVADCQLDDNHFTDVGGGGYALSFQGTFTGNEGFIVTPLDRITEITAGDVIADESSTLIGNPLENGVDVLVVSNSLFLDEMQRWVNYRRAQGYRVLMADPVDVFDEFSGGVPNARAIRRFVRHFYEKGNAAYLLLVGDASEDAKHIHSESRPNFVPTESFTEHVSSTIFNEDETVTTDKWYVMLNKDIVYDPTAVNRPDFYPTLIVGRFPAGSVAELRAIIDKTLAYESPSADDFWRRRMIRVADDIWSGGNFICENGSEVGFEIVENQAADITENSLAGGFDVVRFFLQDQITHPNVTCAQGGVSSFSQCQVTRGSTTGTPQLINELSQGATLVSINAHMNRYQICHEWLLTCNKAIASPQMDQERLQNWGKPFILFGMGCHLSDYAIHREGSRTTQNGPNGDSFSELFLLLENRGAVCTYASTGFEYLTENVNYTRVITQAFFNTPPTDPVEPDSRRQARWIIGEVMTFAEIDNLMRYTGFSGMGTMGQAKRYHLLGDPLLRIDAGPPRFDVSVDGTPVQSGDPVFAGSSSDSISVRAVISDEVAIERLRLVVDGVDQSATMTVTPLVDQSFDAARQYEVTFKHKIRPDTYDIVIEAQQAADTTGTNYHVVAQFVLKVELGITLAVNGRPIVEGDFVPASGSYVFELRFPVEVDPALIRAEIDGEAVTNLTLVHPSPQETTIWLASFTANLALGAHTISIFIDNSEFSYSVNVGGQRGLRDIFAYPNPYVDDTHFVYSNDIAITSGTIDIFTTSGKRIAHLDIPTQARTVGQNAVHWNGRTAAGMTVANGTYLYVINVNQGGRTTTHRGKLVQAK